MNIPLHWEGPLAIEHALPTSADALSKLAKPGIYVWCRKYPDKLAAYVGKTDRIDRRLEQWMTSFLSWHCRVRRPDGTFYSDYYRSTFFQHLGKLDESVDIAKSELRLTGRYDKNQFPPNCARST